MKLQESQMKLAEYSRNVFTVSPVSGVAIETILDPAYWAHVSRKLAPGTILEIVPEDMAYYASLIVMDSSALWAKVAVLSYVELIKPEKIVEDELYEIKFQGPHKKHCVIRKSDRAVLKEEIASKAEAARWIEEHKKAMAS